MELYNPGRAAVDLQGLLLYAARPDGSQERAYLFEQSVPVEPKGYVVLGDVRAGEPVAHVTHSYGDALGSLGNSGGLVGFRCGDVVVDEVRYVGPEPPVWPRLRRERVPDAATTTSRARWCDSPDSGTGPRRAPGPRIGLPGVGADGGVSVGSEGGTDGGASGGTCLSSGTARSVSSPRPGDLVLTEVMADPKAVPDTSGEWVEVYALRDVDLNGVTLANEGSGGATFDDSKCLSLRAGTYGVLARSGDARPTGDCLRCGGPSRSAWETVGSRTRSGCSSGNALIDEVTWTSAAAPGVSRQLDPAREDAARNDAPDAFCLTPEGVSYSAVDRGTPGAENRPCVR